MRLLVFVVLVLNTSILFSQSELEGKWYFRKGKYDDGEKHFGLKTLEFDKDYCVFTSYKLLDQSFDENSVAIRCKGALSVSNDQIEIKFEKDCRATDKLSYTYRISADTLIIRNDAYKKEYFYFKNIEATK